MAVVWTLHDNTGPVATMATGDQALQAMAANHLEGTETFLTGDAGTVGGTGEPVRMVRITIADE